MLTYISAAAGEADTRVLLLKISDLHKTILKYFKTTNFQGPVHKKYATFLETTEKDKLTVCEFKMQQKAQKLFTEAIPALQAKHTSTVTFMLSQTQSPHTLLYQTFDHTFDL